MGSGPSTQQQSQGSSAPWQAQQPYLTGAFADAQNQYNTNIAQGAYSGNYVAPTNQNQADSTQNAYNQAMGTGQQTNNNIIGQGAQQASTGNAGADSALNGLGTAANANLTQQNIGNAQQYAAGENIPGQVQAAMQGANQEAADSTLPNIYRGAAATGNINSDRTAISQGVVDRGLQQQAAGLTATLGNQAYQSGLSQSSTDNAQQLQALSQQGSLGSNLAQQGTNAQTTGINNQGALDNQSVSAANQQQSNDQSNLNNTIQQYTGNQNFGWQQLQNLMGSVGGSYGSQTTGSSTTQQNPSLLQDAGSAAGVLGSLFKSPTSGSSGSK